MSRHEAWRSAVAAVLALGIVCSGWLAARAWAQEAEMWSAPVRVSEGIVDASGQPAASLYPVVAADAWGGVHAFWPARVDEQTTAVGDTLYYASWDGAAWSEPIDVLYRPGQLIWQPQCAADPQGWLHLVWQDWVGGRAWYSRAQVGQARSARGWAAPVMIVAEPVAALALAAGADGRVHVVYSIVAGDEVLYHVGTPDGQAWSRPTPIGGRGVSQARIAVDANDRLHVVATSGSTPDLVVTYVRSDDGGAKWSAPFTIDSKDDRFWEQYGPHAATVFVPNRGEVHIAWLGAPAAHRWHRWSSDGGTNWSAPEAVSTELRLSTWAPALVLDSAGTLHMVSLAARDKYGEGLGNLALYHVKRIDGRWLQPSVVAGWGAQHAEAVVSLGNRLVVVWEAQEGDRQSIWASTLFLAAPALAPATPLAVQPTPTALSAPLTPEPALSTTALVSPEPSANAPQDTAAFPGPQASTSRPSAVMGIVPAILLLGIVVVLWTRRR